MIVLLGKTCSGKDTILNKLVKDYGYFKLTTYTTRPMRKGEIQDKTYHFVSEEEFLDKLNSEFFLEHKKYETAEGEWYYGSAKEDYENGDNNSVIILTPSGFEALKVYIARQKVDIDIVSIYIYANNKTISNRLKKRGDKKEEADRRIKADSVDFKNVVDIVDKIFYNNETNDLDEVVKKVHEYIKYRNGEKTFAEFYMSVGAKASGKLLIRQNIIIIGILSIKPKKKLCGLNLIELNSVMLYL